MEQAFQKIGLILKAISKAVATCLKVLPILTQFQSNCSVWLLQEGLNAYKEGIKAVSSIASVLVGNVGEVIKVLNCASLYTANGKVCRLWLRVLCTLLQTLDLLQRPLRYQTSRWN